MFCAFCQKHGIEKGSPGKQLAFKEGSSSCSGKIKIVCSSKSRPGFFCTAFAVFYKKGYKGRIQLFPGSSICGRGSWMKGDKGMRVSISKFLKHMNSPFIYSNLAQQYGTEYSPGAIRLLPF